MTALPQLIQREFLLPQGLELHRRIRSGLSQAKVWQCKGSVGNQVEFFCLRAWPAGTAQNRLRQIYEAVEQTKSHGVLLLPQYFRSQTGQVYVQDENRHWELTEWRPGEADYASQPNQVKLEAALSGLADLHRVWERAAVRDVSPAMQRRIQFLTEVLTHQDQWRQKTAQVISYHPHARELEELTRATLDASQLYAKFLLGQLKAYHAPCLVHFAIRDLHAEHVLFRGNELTGIIDLGAANIDEPATDLARLTGSLEPNCADSRDRALQFYERAIGHSVDRKRVMLLDAASTLLSAVQWLKWLLLEGREFETSLPVLLKRWRGFLSRLESGTFDEILSLG